MDAIVIRFTTRLFDVANERPNDLGKAKMAADDECAAYVREVLAWVERTMNMTALTVPHDGEVVFIRRQLTPESFLKRIRLASGET